MTWQPLVLGLVGSISLSAASWGQPATVATSEGDPLTVTVSAVQGKVQVRGDENQPWVPAAVGMVLTQDAEFRTGPRSAVQIKIPPEQTITLDRLGVVKVVQAVNDGGVVRTKMGMSYGRTQYEIESAGVEHDAQIASPSNTLAVRGTRFIQEDSAPFPAMATSLTGTVERRDLRSRKATFGGKGTGVARISADSESAAGTAMVESVVDPTIPQARSEGEQPLVESLLSTGAIIGFDPSAGIQVVRGGVPPTDEQLLPMLPGMLNFVLRWDSDADLNLSAFSGALPDDFVYPAAPLNISPTGGTTDFDHRGGAKGGIEVIYWPKKYPSGLYGLGVYHISGGTTNAKVNAYMNGQILPITDFTNGLQDQIVFPIGPGQTRAITAPVNDFIPGFEPGLPTFKANKKRK